MLAVRHGKRAARAWLLPLLLAPFLAALLSSCIRQGGVCGPPLTLSTVVYASGRVYLFSLGAAEVDATSLYALRASDGKELWQAQGILQASDADHLYLLPDQEQVTILEALRASDGKVLWHPGSRLGSGPLARWMGRSISTRTRMTRSWP